MREPMIQVVVAAKGMGKTHTTANEEITNYVTTTPDWKGRKVLIYDTQAEYTDEKLRSKFKVKWQAKVLALKDLRAWTYNGKAEVRRILALDDKNRIVKNVDTKMAILLEILNTFAGGLLVLDDISTYMINPNTVEVISALVSNRHSNLDIILHYQSFRVIRPAIWANLTILRMHNVNERVATVSAKVNNPELLGVAQCLVNYKFKRDRRFKLYINYQEDQIYGAFSKNDYRVACLIYLKENKPDILRVAFNRYGNETEEAYKICIKELEKYFAN